MIVWVVKVVELFVVIVFIGVNGFLVQYCVSGLLSRGYCVVSIVCSEVKVQVVKRFYGNNYNVLIVVIVDIIDVSKI